ncbi:SDR family oxidoreductase [Desulfotomaculum nigrificans]|uniref:SDR family oxidoreductase n=1 Tax=Desulfotomaculum nigrificans TaxID=1565 RepID=UPI0001FADE19|nr:SDR family oxidoreductase [Desulfotomaculum nigrificans]
MSLKGKTAILFGAGAIAEGYTTLFAEEGMNLVIVSRGKSAHVLAEKVNGRGGSNAIALNADASDYAQMAKVFEETEKRFKQIDIVINGSGGNSPDATANDLEGFINMDPEAPVKMLNNNYTSKWYAMQLYMAYLQRTGYQGSVVNITSMSGFVPIARVVHYSAAFAAVENLAKSMAYLYGHYGLGRVNNLAVGFTIGEQNRKLLTNEDGTYTARGQEVVSLTAQHRFLSAQEIAPHVLYLADADKTASINGITLRVDGGFGLIHLNQSSYTDKN